MGCACSSPGPQAEPESTDAYVATPTPSTTVYGTTSDDLQMEKRQFKLDVELPGSKAPPPAVKGRLDSPPELKKKKVSDDERARRREEALAAKKKFAQNVNARAGEVACRTASLPQVAAAFQTYAAGKDKMSLDEARKAVGELTGWGVDKAADMVARYNADGDNYFSKAEFKKLMAGVDPGMEQVKAKAHAMGSAQTLVAATATQSA